MLPGLLPANFDPRAYDAPDELDVRRDTGRGDGHLGFGQGAHYCLGGALARQEAEVGLRAPFTRFGELRLDRSEVDTVNTENTPDLPLPSTTHRVSVTSVRCSTY